MRKDVIFVLKLVNLNSEIGFEVHYWSSNVFRPYSFFVVVANLRFTLLPE